MLFKTPDTINYTRPMSFYHYSIAFIKETYHRTTTIELTLVTFIYVEYMSFLYTLYQQVTFVSF